MKQHHNRGRCSSICLALLGILPLPTPRGSRVGEAPRLPQAPPSAPGPPRSRTSSPVSAGSTAGAPALPLLRTFGNLPVVGASAGALRHPRPPQGRRATGFTARARAAASAVCNPAGEEGIAATSQPGGFRRGGASREAAALPAGARARPRPHVSLRPRGMWVTKPSGLTCPRPPPPPQRPLCNAASRARPANRRPRAAERKHSAHVARAARPCEGGAGPAPPGRAAAVQGTRGATRGVTGAETAAGRKRAAAHPVDLRDARRPPKCPQRAPSALSAVPDPPQAGSYLHSPPWCPRGGDRGCPLPAEGAAPPPPQRRAAPDRRQRGSRGRVMGRAGGAPGTRGRRAGCSSETAAAGERRSSRGP